MGGHSGTIDWQNNSVCPGEEETELMLYICTLEVSLRKRAFNVFSPTVRTRIIGPEVGTLELPLLVRVGSFFFFSSLKLSLVKIFTKVPYLRHSYYTGSEEKESFCLKIVGRYGS